jgi:hypothetical protein
MFRNLFLLLSLTTVSADPSCLDIPPPCDNAECITLHNDPFFVCDCLPGYIPTADPTICVPGQAYDHGGDGNFDLCDDAHCDPDSTCNQDKGYVECVCPDDRSVFQGVECDTNSGFDWDQNVGVVDDPCAVDNNLCDPRSDCVPRAKDSTLAECHCNTGSGLVILPGFACPGGGGGGDTSSVQDPCSPNQCDPKATCQPAHGGLVECICPSGDVLRPFYVCPVISGNVHGEPIPVEPALDAPNTSECSPSVKCADGSTCTLSKFDNVMCQCPGAGPLVYPNRGSCQDLCHSNGNNPCGQNASCEMASGWAQCSCDFGPVLHYENCE